MRLRERERGGGGRADAAILQLERLVLWQARIEVRTKTNRESKTAAATINADV